jgi:hypothetical protein
MSASADPASIPPEVPPFRGATVCCALGKQWQQCGDCRVIFAADRLSAIGAIARQLFLPACLPLCSTARATDHCWWGRRESPER